MKNTGKLFGVRNVVLGLACIDPLASALAAAVAIWAGLGFAAGYLRDLNIVEGVLCAVLAALVMGLLKGMVGGLTAREHIYNPQFREDVHRRPFLCMLPMQIVGFMPYAAMLYFGGILPGEGEYAIAAIAGTVLCAAIGAWGHTTDSRGWDVFWQGGGLAGLIASKLDNIAYGPSPLDA